MKSVLLFDLIRFALAKKTTLEKLRYIVLGIVFYSFLVRTLAGDKGDDVASSSQAGDDIYPLF